MQISNAIDPGMMDSMSSARSNMAKTSPQSGMIGLDGGMPPVAASNEVDIDSLMKAWGSNNATWDIDGNGKVDGSDLGMLLAAMEAAANGDADLQSLLDAWGSDNAQWDFNDDGVVNGVDLGLYLADGNSGAPESDAVQSLMGFMKAWGSDHADYDINGDGIVDGGDLGKFLAQLDIDTDMATLEQFLSAWGSDDPQWDFNGDGIVDGADLGLLLDNNIEPPIPPMPPIGHAKDALKMPPMPPIGHAKDALMDISATKARRIFEGQTSSGASKVAGQLMKTLQDCGFADKLPVNIKAALNHLPLDGVNHQDVLEKLMAQGMSGAVETVA